MTQKTEIYKGGYFKLLRELDQRQRPFENLQAVLPPADVDLDGLFNSRVEAPLKSVEDCPRHTAEAKWAQLQQEFTDQSALEHLHAMLIAVCRRKNPPFQAIELFHRIWSEKGDEIASLLSTRWLISAATTFADYGQTSDQRALGMGLSTLFDLIKLHDSERRVSGQSGEIPFKAETGASPSAMPLQMPAYSLKKGDLDRRLLARLWKLCERDATIRPLGMRMLWMVMTDQRSIFARLQRYKTRGKG